MIYKISFSVYGDNFQPEKILKRIVGEYLIVEVV